MVVTGLPRSGTSMMMQMLAAGGIPPLTDGERPADESNPRGYLEYSPVKRLASDRSWVGEARGKAVKVVGPAFDVAAAAAAVDPTLHRAGRHGRASGEP